MYGFKRRLKLSACGIKSFKLKFKGLLCEIMDINPKTSSIMEIKVFLHKRPVEFKLSWMLMGLSI